MTAPLSSKNCLPAILLPVVLILWACTTGIIPATGEKGYVGFTWEEERELGKQAAQEIAAVFGIYQMRNSIVI